MNVSDKELRFLAAFALHALLGLGTRSNQRAALGAASSHAGVDAPSTQRIAAMAQASSYDDALNGLAVVKEPTGAKAAR